MKWAEVAPLAPLLIPLAEILVWALALAICLASGYIVKAFFGTVGGLVAKLPVVGGWLDAGVHDVEKRITRVLSGAAASLDAKLGAAQHMLAREVDWLGREIRRHANLLELIAGILGGTAGITLVQKVINDVRRLIHPAKATATHALRTAIVAGKTARVGIGHDVLPRLRSLDKEIERVTQPEIAGIRKGERALEHGAIRTWDWILRHPRSIASTAFAGAVAWALARLGAGWIRCKNWNKIGKQVCGTPLGEIEGLLGLLSTALVVGEFREMVKLAQTVAKDTDVWVQEIFRV